METESSSYAFGPFVLDSRSRTLLRESHPLTLTSKTFDLLLILVENNGRTLGKDELMAILWPDTVVEEANLTQMIFLLRKALGDDPREAEYILTVHRRGYRFIADVRKVSEGEDRRDWRLLARPRRVRAGAGALVILSLAVIGLLVRHYAQSRPRQSASLVSPIETAQAPAVSLV